MLNRIIYDRIHGYIGNSCADKHIGINRNVKGKITQIGRSLYPIPFFYLRRLFWDNIWLIQGSIE